MNNNNIAIECFCENDHNWFAHGVLQPDGLVDYQNEEGIFCPFCFEPNLDVVEDYGVVPDLDESDRQTIIGMYREVWEDNVVTWIDTRTWEGAGA